MESRKKYIDNSREKSDSLSFSFDLDMNQVDYNSSSDSEAEGLRIDVSEIEDYDSNLRRNQRKKIEDVSILENMEEEIERQLDAKAAKINLTATNVKNILKHVITNEHVMAMVQKRLLRNNSDDNIIYEPKLTRAKAKELGALAQPNIPWPSTPIKTASSEVQVLIEEELPEDSSDEEYRPDQDQHESDDDKDIRNSFRSDLHSQSSTPVTSSVDNYLSFEPFDSTKVQYDSEGIFKIPKIPRIPTEGESIGHRTRSKLSLSETPLETIEQAFIPPDITMDMYESGCIDEDYKNFLQDFWLPLPQEFNVEDDPEADPEYNILEDDEAELLDKEELRMDKAVKVSRKEVKDLMDELYEYASEYGNEKYSKQKQNDNQESPKKKRSNEITAPSENNPSLATVDLIPVLSEPDLPMLVNTEQRHLLTVQLRHHVQLMVQHYLMCYRHPEHHKWTKSCKSNIESLSYLGTGPYSAFNVENLLPALKLILKWEGRFKEQKFQDEYHDFLIEEMKIVEKENKSRRLYNQKFHPELERMMMESEALSFPQLLPRTFPRPKQMRKCENYLNSEINLIALGLEQFIPYVMEMKNKFKSSKMILQDAVKLIRTYILPCREQKALVDYIQRLRRSTKNNPVKQFYETGQAPKTIHYITLDFTLRAPKDQPIEFLPERWQTWLRELKKNRKNNFRGNKTDSEKLAIHIERVRPGIHLRQPIVNMMPSASLKEPEGNKKKSNSAANSSLGIIEEPMIITVFPDTTIKGNKKETANQRKLPQLRKTTPRLAKMRSAQSIKSMSQVINSKEVSHSSVKSKIKIGSSKKTNGILSSIKRDNEDEIAELMLASTTIKKSTNSRKEAKQARELENVKRLFTSENEFSVEERATKFAASYLQKLHTTLESSNPEAFKSVIKLYLEYSEKMDNILQTENENDSRIDDGEITLLNERQAKFNKIKITKDTLTVDLYRKICDSLRAHPELCSDFLLFLNSHQAAMIDKSMEWMMLQKMQEFVHVAQVYFAKQPSRLAKVMQSLSQLAAETHTPLQNVHEIMGPVLKGYPLVMDMFLQVFPDGKPPESLFAPQLFENMTCPIGPHEKNKIYPIDAPELYEAIELPTSTNQEDRYGGDNCRCNCHEASDSNIKIQNEHCASCGTRFLNGRIYLQTSEGLRPAKITFPGETNEKLENIARVSLKTTEKVAQTPVPSKRGRKSSKNDSGMEESNSKIATLKEHTEDGTTKFRRGPKSPSKGSQSSTNGVKKSIPISKNLREKRAEKRESRQEKKSKCSRCDSTHIMKESPSLNDVLDESCMKMEILTDEEDKNTSTEKTDFSSNSESSLDETEESSNFKPWSKEEDAILLQNIKKDYSERSFSTISNILEDRTVQQVKDRCRVLLTLLEKLV